MGLSEFAAGFEYTKTERGISCTRVFHYTPASGGPTGATLPKLGDSFTPPAAVASVLGLTTLSTLICRSRSIRCLAGDSTRFEYKVTYSNEPVDTGVFSGTGTPPVNVNDLPKTVEFSGEYVTIEPSTSSGWKWSDDKAVLQPLSFRVNESTLRIVRYVPDFKMQNFQIAIRSLVGKVNANDDPFGSRVGGKKRCWLFTGATAEMFYNGDDVKFWKAELEFIYRNPDYSNTEGWNKLLRFDGMWDVPLNPNPIDPAQNKLYVDGDFSPLFI